MTTTTEVLVPTMEKAAVTADRAEEKAAKMAKARMERTRELGKTAATTLGTTITSRRTGITAVSSSVLSPTIAGSER